MKTRFFLFVGLSVFLHILLTANSFGCSAFLMKGNDYCLLGFNENWKSMPGMVVVNKRNVAKRNLSWNYLVSEAPPSEPSLTWTSKLGSVTFSLLGLDLPCYGMNEKGLFIVELYLDKTYSLPDSSKARMFWGQWIQYQLDNYATVKELIGHLNNAPVIDWWPTFPGSHFFVCDGDGNTAAVELINGKFQVSALYNMPVPVLCNRPYSLELKKIQKYLGFGGAETFNIHSQIWNDRFSKAAHLIKNYSAAMGIKPLEYAWNVLDSIHPGVWQLVGDVKKKVLYFRSDQGRDIKHIDLSRCDFSEGSPVTYIDINSHKQGDITNDLFRFTVEVNDEYVMKGFPVGYENSKFYESDRYTNLKKNLHRYVEEIVK